MTFFKCENCGNIDPRFIGVKNGTKYCRRCLTMTTNEVIKNQPFPKVYALADIHYPLTKEQDKIAKRVTTNYINGIDSLIYAVCGAGKTELVFDVIKTALARGEQIGFTIPRREVVIEIYGRLKSAFPSIDIALVHGNHTKHLRGQIIVLTTHQLYRYKAFFDLLIFDEVDAFPYADDFVLTAMFKASLRGNVVVMSATPSQSLLDFYAKNGEVLTLFTRFHHQPIPVPTIRVTFGLLKYLWLIINLRRLTQKGKKVLVFAPTIQQAERIFLLVHLICKKGNIVHSKITNVGTIIADFKRGKYDYLVTTTILERGITIKGLQVIVFAADHPLFDMATLIQISGRVGRKKDEPSGEVIFIAKNSSSAMKEAVHDIKEKNCYLQTMYEQRNQSYIE